MKSTKVFLSFIKLFLPIAAASTIILTLLYLSVQQNYRQSANDPQIQLSEDSAQALAQGKNISDFQMTQKIEISQSLAPFIMVFDDNGNLSASTGVLHGQTPQVPSGIFFNTKLSGEERLTWQPANDTRIASVITHFSGKQSGFVLAGRNLREIEKREGMLTFHMAIGWIGTLLVTATVCLAVVFL